MTHRGDRPVITVDVGRPGAAIVTVRGEHDLATEPHLLQALREARAHGPVLVDLSECTFMASSVVHTLKRCAAGGALAVVLPPHARVVQRAAQLMNLTEIAPVHETLEGALAHIVHEA